MAVALTGLFLGVFAGCVFALPYAGGALSAVTMLAALNSIVGGARARLERRYDHLAFSAGLLANTGLAALFCVFGERFDVPLELAVFVYFGYHILKGFSSFIKAAALTRNTWAEPEVLEEVTAPEELVSDEPETSEAVEEEENE